MRLALLTPAEREQFKRFIVEHTDVPYEPVWTALTVWLWWLGIDI
jgi:hypothetical protein